MTISGVKEYDVLVNGVVEATVSGTSAVITGLTPNTEYDVTVRARDNAGNVSAQSAVLPVMTDAASSDGEPPSVPSGLGSSSITSTTATVSWSPSTDNVGVTAYQVFVNGVSKGTTGSTSFGLTGLMPGTAHNVTVRAGDAAGNWSAQSAAHVVTTESAPVTPDLVAQWLFAEGSGTAATDSVDGKVLTFGAAPTWTTGPGTLDAVQVAYFAAGATSGSLAGLQNAHRTIAFWARRDSAEPAWLRGVAFKSGGTSCMLVAISAASPYEGELYARARTGGVDRNIIGVPYEAQGEWHHYALTHDGTTARLFVDAVEAGTVAAAGTVDSASSLVFGENGGGTYADVRIYSQALDASEISAVMAEV